ncbi:hypothetical protein ScPMuIL_008855 [Solemya velum]
MKVSSVLNCSFSSWYNQFKSNTIKSVIIPIPPEFVDYLNADGVVLPEGAAAPCDDSHSDTDEFDIFLDPDPDTPIAKVPSFPDFEKAVKRGINKLGGRVFPKLNWSAPRDASWISFDRTLKCTCPSDIYLLLKSSEFVTHDLTEPFDECTDFDEQRETLKIQYELILRHWEDLHPGHEFRCFVQNGKIIAISQRYQRQYFEFIKKAESEILADIQAFFHHVIANKFPDKDYVFDVYRRDEGKMILLDFNPFAAVTDSLLFSWDELRTLQQNSSDVKPEFRYLETSDGVQPSQYAQYTMPQDFVDLCTGQDPYKLVDFLKMRVTNQESDSSSEEGSALSDYSSDNSQEQSGNIRLSLEKNENKGSSQNPT